MGTLKSGAPFLGLCGYSGSGKTTILEKLAARLVEKGLSVGYLKHDAHKLKVDKEGKDTQRLFDSGVGVLTATSHDESFSRIKSGNLDHSIFAQCDIVLVEGYKNAPWDKLWVHPHSGEKDKVPALDKVVEEIAKEGSLVHNDAKGLENFVASWLNKKVSKKPMYGGLLVGGQSRRMGTPKTRLPLGESTYAEKQRALLNDKCDHVYILGNAPLPESLSDAERISDPPDINGPIAGLISAHRFAPEADWLIAAVDLPNVDSDYLNRLLERRVPGFRIVAAQNPEKGKPEPLCALYSSQLLHRINSSFNGELSVNAVLERLGINGNSALYDEEKLKNVNRPEDLHE